ncbi:MAG: protein kinase [Gemmataceae bacterium]
MNQPSEPQPVPRPEPADDPSRTTERPASSAPPETPRAAITPRDPAPVAADDPLRTGAHVPSGDTDPLATGAYLDTDPPSPAVPGAPAVPGYEILGELGKGGMGVVYKARQTGLNRVVALKMILAGPHAAPAAVARFLAEARAVARFQHPNVVQIFDVGEAAGLPYFALEFVDGPTLAKQIGRAPTPPAYAAAVAEELARAVAYAHAQGVVHRDLKPANVLLAPDGTAKVTDFGLAKYDDDSGQTQTGQILGTPSYMAPEQAEGRDDVGPPADVYALGAILYDLLTGRPPFVGASAIDTITLVRTREPVPPRQLAAGVPRDLETICLKCLQKDPARRYASAAAVADDLRRFRAGEPIVARPVSAAEKAWRWAKRNPVGAAATALAAVVFFGGPVVAWQMYQLAGSESAARAQAEQDRAQAEQDRDAKEKARAAEEVAKGVAVEKQHEAEKQAAIAGLENAQAVATIRTVLLTVDAKMKTKATLAPLRLEILNTMLKDLDKVKEYATEDPFKTKDGRRLPAARVLTQNIATAYGRIGETYLKANRVEESAPWLEKGLVAYRAELAAAGPEPVTLRNVAVLLNMNSDAKIRLGDAAAARAMRVEALALRRDRATVLADNPPGKSTPAQLAYLRASAAEDVATSLRLVADADLLLGDPAAAAAGYEAARKGLDAVPPYAGLEDRFRFAQERAAVEDYLGDAKLKTRDPVGAQACYQTALKLREAAAASHPAFRFPFHTLAAQSRVVLGDFLLTARADRPAAAAEYAAAHAAFTALLAEEPDSLTVQRALGHTHYRLGVVAADPADARKHFDDSLAVRAVLGKIDPKDTQAQFELLTSLGRCGKAQAAEKLAGELKALAPRDPRVLFQVACGLSVAAGGATGTDAARLRDKALAALDALPAAGWRDGHAFDHDPDLAAVRADPRFAAVRARVPAPKR